MEKLAGGGGDVADKIAPHLEMKVGEGDYKGSRSESWCDYALDLGLTSMGIIRLLAHLCFPVTCLECRDSPLIGR